MDQMVRNDTAGNCIPIVELLFGTHTFHFNCFFDDFNCVFTQIHCCVFMQIHCLSRVLEIHMQNTKSNSFDVLGQLSQPVPSSVDR